MNKLTGKFAVLTVALGSALALAACNVEKTEEGELPDVDVEATGGEMPAYDVETPEVDIDADVEMPNEPDAEVTDEVDSAADDDLGPGLEPTENDALDPETEALDPDPDAVDPDAEVGDPAEDGLG